MRYRQTSQRILSKEKIALSNGLAGLWSGLGSGLTLLDRTEKGQEGVISGGYDWILGPDSKTVAPLFDGTNGKATVAVKANPNAYASRSFSITFWLWTVSNGTKGLIDPGTAGTGGQTLIWLYSGPKIRFDVAGASAIIYSNTFKTRDWTHLGCTWDDDAKTQSVYVNGVLHDQQTVGSGASTDFNASDTWYFGSMGGNFYANAAFGEVRFYNRALSSSEVYTLGQVSFNSARLAGGVASISRASSSYNVPGAPTGLTATTQSATQINLSWTAPADNGGASITGYKIERESPVDGGWSTIVADTGDTDTTYSNTGLLGGTEYNYRVSAINSIGTGSASNEADDTTDSTVPGAPTSLTATTASKSQIDLSWSAPADNGGQNITGYKIERESPEGGGFSTIVADTGDTDTTYSNTGLLGGTEYNYRVSAINSIGTGSASNEDKDTTSAATAPGQVTGLSASASTYEQVDLTWSAPADDGASPITGYKIERESPEGGGWGTLVADTGDSSTSYSDTGLDAETEYNYRVSAINAVGTGTASTAAKDTTPEEPTGPPVGTTATLGAGR